MGSVWRAHDLRTGHDVALKVLGRHSSTLLARFVREQAVRVRHPHVVAPHGWVAEDDLGVAAPVADRRFTTVPGAIGTDGYMAPEQARGAPPEPTQDLYAVGRVALELVTGEPPARQDVVPSHPLRPLVERLLVADPEQRIATAE